MVALWTVLLAMPVRAASGVTLSPVLITEVKTGTAASAAQEFIELTNTTDQPVDMSGWQLWYFSAQSTLDAPTHTVLLGGSLDAHAIMTLTGAAGYPDVTAQQTYSFSMAGTGASIALMRPADAACQLTLVDGISWGSAATPLLGQAAGAPGTSQSLARRSTIDGTWQETADTAADFWVTSTPTPGLANNADDMPAPDDTAPDIVLPPDRTVPDATCQLPVPPGDGSATPPADGTPQPGSGADAPVVVNAGLSPPAITELLPNPASPQTDDADEFIELYNPNTQPFSLDGYILCAGATTAHNFTVPTGTILPPQTYVAFFSSQTNLSLANNGGQAWLLDADGNVVSQSAAYGTAGDGQAWALIDDNWQWTTTPTPGAANSLALAAPASSSKSSTVKTAAKKTAAVKAASTTKAKAAKPAATKKPAAKKKPATSLAAQTVTTPHASPLHPALLAIAVLFALLYAAYEYRHDLANKLQHLRRRRSTGREDRPRPKGG